MSDIRLRLTAAIDKGVPLRSVMMLARMIQPDAER